MNSVQSSNLSFKESCFYSYRKAMPKKYLEPINTINQFTKKQLDNNIQNLKTKERKANICTYVFATILGAISILGIIVFFTSSLAIFSLGTFFVLIKKSYSSCVVITTLRSEKFFDSFVIIPTLCGIVGGFGIFIGSACINGVVLDLSIITRNERDPKIKFWENRMLFKIVMKELQESNSTIKEENLKKLKEIWQYPEEETEKTQETAKKIAECLILYNYLLENMGEDLKNFLKAIQKLTSENIFKKEETDIIKKEETDIIINIFKNKIIKNKNFPSFLKEISKEWEVEILND